MAGRERGEEGELREAEKEGWVVGGMKGGREGKREGGRRSAHPDTGKLEQLVKLVKFDLTNWSNSCTRWW